MGYSAWRRKLRHSIEKEWRCLGYFGYGQGRAVAELGEDGMRGKSACYDICQYQQLCNRRHHARMDYKYPQLAAIARQAFKAARESGGDVVVEVVEAMERSVELEVEEAVEVQGILKRFGVDAMTDHYRAGQCENIQDGLDKKSLRSSLRVIDDDEVASTS